MPMLQERALRQVVKTALTTQLGEANKELVQDLVQYLLHAAYEPQVKVEAGLIRTIDRYHGVSEASLQAGRAIYLAMTDDEE